MAQNVNIDEWIENFDNGKYDKPDFGTQVAAGWFDWFCKVTSLAGKTKRLASKVKRIAKSGKFDNKRCYVWFKNNCPLSGHLYDDFRIADLESGDVIYTITPMSGRTGNSEVWGEENGFNGPLVEGTWADVCRFFGV